MDRMRSGNELRLADWRGKFRYDQSGYMFALHVGNARHRYSLVPRLSHHVVFDRLPVCNCACMVEGIKNKKTGWWEGLGTKLATTYYMLYALSKQNCSHVLKCEKTFINSYCFLQKDGVRTIVM